MKVHKVQPGECMSSIADKYGFHQWKTVYQAPENEDLRMQRPNPNVLFPGDEVVIPEKQRRTERAATETRHSYLLKTGQCLLRLELTDELGVPLKGYPYKLEVDGKLVAEAETTDEGLIEERIPFGATSGILEFMGEAFQIRLGQLDPVQRVLGIQQRLTNLGYPVGTLDGIWGPKTSGALRRFQSEQEGLDATGRIDRKTRGRLEEIHDGTEQSASPFEDEIT